MGIRIKELNLINNKAELCNIPEGKILINTINAFSYNNARKDNLFEEALLKGDYLLPDGISIVKACRWLNARSQPTERVAGWDLFVYEMQKRNITGGRVMFMGSSNFVLEKIKEQAAKYYPSLEIITYSPPYKPEFSEVDNKEIIQRINEADPDLLWIGMTAPKQEKWAYSHWKELNIHCHVGTIGAVFDFFAGTSTRAPLRIQQYGLEWLYRLYKEPRRMWRRYLLGNPLFVWYVLKEKFMFD